MKGGGGGERGIGGATKDLTSGKCHGHRYRRRGHHRSSRREALMEVFWKETMNYLELLEEGFLSSSNLRSMSRAMSALESCYLCKNKLINYNSGSNLLLRQVLSCRFGKLNPLSLAPIGAKEDLLYHPSNTSTQTPPPQPPPSRWPHPLSSSRSLFHPSFPQTLLQI